MRPVFLVDVDGTIADLGLRVFSYLHSLLRVHRPEVAEKIEQESLKKYEQLVKENSGDAKKALRAAGLEFLMSVFSTARRLQPRERLDGEAVDLVARALEALGSGDAQEAESAFNALLQREELRRIVKERVEESIYPEALSVLKELAGNGDVILFSRSFHALVRMLADHIRERHGVPVRALGGGYVALGAGWLNFKELADILVPGGKGVRRVFVDNPDVRLPRGSVYFVVRGKEDLLRFADNVHAVLRGLRHSGEA